MPPRLVDDDPSIQTTPQEVPIYQLPFFSPPDCGFGNLPFSSGLAFKSAVRLLFLSFRRVGVIPFLPPSPLTKLLHNGHPIRQEKKFVPPCRLFFSKLFFFLPAPQKIPTALRPESPLRKKSGIYFQSHFPIVVHPPLFFLFY